MNRITNATYQGALEESFVYDAAGNRTSHTDIDGDTVGYTVDATGQLVSDTAGTTYSYDAAGNLTATSAGEAYVYDDFGRATEITIEGVTEQYTYDAQDVRVTVDGTTQLWDRNGLPTLISTGAGDNYVHAAGIARDGDDWLLQDAVGSVRATVDQTGATVGTQNFTVFGETRTGDGTFGFTGEQLDTTGLVHLRARQYNPTIGRFTTVDPVQPGAQGTTGYNLYTYVANNPTTFTDPSGEAVLVEYSRIGAVVGATVGFGVGVFTCADGESGLGGAEARCVAAYTIGGAVFGGVGPASSLGFPATCAVGGAFGAVEGAAVTAAAGETGIARNALIGGGLGCGFGAATAALRGVIRSIPEDAARGLIPFIDAPAPSRPPLFRGTTEGFTGGPGIQSAGLTPTTDNPAVATAFATRGLQFNSDAVVLVDGSGASIVPADIPRRLPNESEFPLEILPSDFAASASASIPVQDARVILNSMGISVPGSISDTSSLREVLSGLPQMSPAQVQEFIRRAEALR